MRTTRRQQAGIGAALFGAGLTLVLGLMIGMADTAAADDTPPYNCTQTRGGTASLCEHTRTLGPVGWAVVIGLVLLVILGIGWMLRLRQRRRIRLERRRHGWRRFLRRRNRVIDRY